MTKSDEQFTKELVSTTYALIHQQSQEMGGLMSTKNLSVNFLATFMGAMVYATLSKGFRNPDLTEDQKEALVFENFRTVKQNIQDAVAAAISSAMSEYSGQSVEYYCQVKPLPPVANTQPC